MQSKNNFQTCICTYPSAKIIFPVFYTALIYFSTESQMPEVKTENTANTGSFPDLESSAQLLMPDPDLTVQCDICNMKLTSKQHLRKHQQNEHSTHLLCIFCQEDIFVEEGKAEMAYSNHLINCQKEFAMKIRTFPPKNRCEKCDKNFYTDDSFEKHKHACGTGLAKVTCGYCQCIFNTGGTATMHMYVEHVGFRCLECECLFETWTHLAMHNKEKHDKYSEKCDQCVNDEQYLSHLVKEHNTQVHCVLCAQSLTDVNDMVNHNLMGHKNIMFEHKMKFQCNMCTLICDTRQSLISHIHQHKGLFCAMCSKYFDNLELKIKHEASEHGEVSTDMLPTGHYYCHVHIYKPKSVGSNKIVYVGNIHGDSLRTLVPTEKSEPIRRGDNGTAIQEIESELIDIHPSHLYLLLNDLRLKKQVDSLLEYSGLRDKVWYIRCCQCKKKLPNMSAFKHHVTSSHAGLANRGVCHPNPTLTIREISTNPQVLRVSLSTQKENVSHSEEQLTNDDVSQTIVETESDSDSQSTKPWPLFLRSGKNIESYGNQSAQSIVWWYEILPDSAKRRCHLCWLPGKKNQLCWYTATELQLHLELTHQASPETIEIMLHESKLICVKCVDRGAGSYKKIGFTITENQPCRLCTNIGDGGKLFTAKDLIKHLNDTHLKCSKCATFFLQDMEILKMHIDMSHMESGEDYKQLGAAIQDTCLIDGVVPKVLYIHPSQIWAVLGSSRLKGQIQACLNSASTFWQMKCSECSDVVFTTLYNLFKHVKTDPAHIIWGTPYYPNEKLYITKVSGERHILQVGHTGEKAIGRDHPIDVLPRIQTEIQRTPSQPVKISEDISTTPLDGELNLKITNVHSLQHFPENHVDFEQGNQQPTIKVESSHENQIDIDINQVKPTEDNIHIDSDIFGCNIQENTPLCLEESEGNELLPSNENCSTKSQKSNLETVSIKSDIEDQSCSIIKPKEEDNQEYREEEIKDNANITEAIEYQENSEQNKKKEKMNGGDEMQHQEESAEGSTSTQSIVVKQPDQNEQTKNIETKEHSHETHESLEQNQWTSILAVGNEVYMYKCKSCSLIQTDKQAAIQHFKSCLLTCKFCNQSFRQEDELQCHLKEHVETSHCSVQLSHSDLTHENLLQNQWIDILAVGNEVFKCKSCSLIQTNKQAAIQHFKSCLLTCKVCNQSFGSEDELRFHLKVHVDTSHQSSQLGQQESERTEESMKQSDIILKQPCMICYPSKGYIYFTAQELEKHIENDHRTLHVSQEQTKTADKELSKAKETEKTVGSQVSLPCMICTSGEKGSTLFTYEQLMLHFETYHNWQKPDQRPRSNKRKSSAMGDKTSDLHAPTKEFLPLEKRQKSASETKVSEETSKSSSSQLESDYEMAYTVRTSSSFNKLYKCEYCPSEFDCLDHFLEHKSMFHPTCSKCQNGRHFLDWKSLESHQETHYEYQCHICWRRFLTYPELRFHLDEYLWMGENAQALICPKENCSKRFHISKALKWHLSTEHRHKRQRYHENCIVCGAKMPNGMQFETHMKKKHGIIRIGMRKVKRKKILVVKNSGAETTKSPLVNDNSALSGTPTSTISTDNIEVSNLNSKDSQPCDIKMENDPVISQDLPIVSGPGLLNPGDKLQPLFVLPGNCGDTDGIKIEPPEPSVEQDMEESKVEFCGEIYEDSKNYVMRLGHTDTPKCSVADSGPTESKDPDHTLSPRGLRLSADNPPNNVNLSLDGQERIQLNVIDITPISEGHDELQVTDIN